MAKNSKKVVELRHTVKQFLREEEAELRIPIRIIHYDLIERTAGTDYTYIGEEFHGCLDGPEGLELVIAASMQPDSWEDAVVEPLRILAIESTVEGLQAEIFNALNYYIANDPGGDDDLG